jgi:hypothetical protein
MTALPSVRLLEALADLQELREERGQPAQDDVRFQRIHDALLYMLHCLTGSSHDGEAN